MAEKKSATAPVATDESPVFDPDKKVKIKLPRVRGEEDSVFVCVNGRSFLIKRGIEVEVPLFVELAIRESEELEEIAYNHIDRARTD